MAVKRAADAFGYRAVTTLEQGIHRTVDWLRDSGAIAVWLESERAATGRRAA